MAATGRGCVKTPETTQFKGRQTIPRVSIVDPGASNSLGISREIPFFEFSHSLGRLPQFTTAAIWRSEGQANRTAAGQYPPVTVTFEFRVLGRGFQGGVR
jgi:hypothetical protein